MESQLELRVLAVLAPGAAPPYVVARRLRRRADDGLYASLRRLEQRGCVQRLRGRSYRLTRRGRARLGAEVALERLLARSA